MKLITFLLILMSQVAFSYAKTPGLSTRMLSTTESEALPTPTQRRDYTSYAYESLQHFYSLIIECVLDPDNQIAFLEDSEDYLNPKGQYVADLMGIFPKDELHSLENYLSEIKMHYPYLLRDSSSIAEIRTDSIKIKKSVPRNKGLELTVSYRVKLVVDQKELYSGNSEASITYPNANNKYLSQINSVRPSAYLRYMEAIISGYSLEKWSEMANDAMKSHDYTFAKQLYQDMIQNGYREALYDMAVLYRDGKGGSVDNQFAANYFKAYIGRKDLKESLVSNQMCILVKQSNSGESEVWRVNSKAKERYCNALSFMAYISRINHDNTTALVYYRKLRYLRPTALVYYNMGCIYADTKDQATYDLKLAKEYLEMSADLGYEKAKEELGKLNGPSGYN